MASKEVKPKSSSKTASMNSSESHNDKKEDSDSKDYVIASEKDIEKQTAEEDITQQATTEDETPQPNPDIVEFDGPDDPDNPKNWTPTRRACITVCMGLMTFVVTFSSSIFAIAIAPVAEEFNVGTPVATLGVSFFLLVQHPSDPLLNQTRPANTIQRASSSVP